MNHRTLPQLSSGVKLSTNPCINHNLQNLQACVKLKLEGGQEMYSLLLEYIFDQSNRQPLNKLTPEPLALLLAAIAALDLPLLPRQADNFAKQCIFRIDEFKLRDLAAVILACRRLHLSPLGGGFFNQIAKKHPELEGVIGVSRPKRTRKPARRAPSLLPEIQR